MQISKNEADRGMLSSTSQKMSRKHFGKTKVYEGEQSEEQSRDNYSIPI